MRTWTKWEDKHDEYLRNNCNQKSNKELAKEMNKSYESIKKRIYRLKIKRNPEFAQKIRNKASKKTQFKKGHKYQKQR